MKFLRHVVSQEGISLDPAKVDAILQWERPKNVSEIRNFLGLPRYDQCFIENFSKIVAPLMRLTRKDIKFDWDDSCESAFIELKQRLANALIFTVPNSQEPYVVYTDESGTGLGCVLTQNGSSDLCFSPVKAT